MTTKTKRVLTIGIGLVVVVGLIYKSQTAMPKCDDEDVKSTLSGIYKDVGLNVNKLDTFSTISSDGKQIQCEARGDFSMINNPSDKAEGFVDYSARYDDAKENVVVTILKSKASN